MRTIYRNLTAEGNGGRTVKTTTGRWEHRTAVERVWADPHVGEQKETVFRQGLRI